MTREVYTSTAGIMIIAMLLGGLVAMLLDMSGRLPDEVVLQPASLASQQAEQACLQRASDELELLAASVLEGNDVVIKDGYVTIILEGGDVLASGEFLAGTEPCQHLITGEQ